MIKISRRFRKACSKLILLLYSVELDHFVTTEMCKAVNSLLQIAAEESHMENKQPGICVSYASTVIVTRPFPRF